ncbi:MAG: HAMP domain-containing sensor histidine kinase [Bacteroidota bacterium]
MQFKGHTVAARITLSFILQTFIVLLIMFLARGRMAEYFLFVIMMLFMMLFYDKKIFIPLYLFNLAMFYVPQIVYQPYPPEIFSWTNPVVLFISLTVVIYYFHKNWRYNESLLAKKNEELLKLNEEKSHLISIAAHDLKSPLSRIDGLLSIIQMTASNLTEEQKGLIHKISEVSRNQNEMIKQVLDLRSIDTRKQSDLCLVKVDLNKLLDELLESFKTSAKNKQIDLIKVNADQQVFINTEPVYLQNALENLLSNAIKFSHPQTSVSLDIKEKNSSKHYYQH